MDEYTLSAMEDRIADLERKCEALERVNQYYKNRLNLQEPEIEYDPE